MKQFGAAVGAHDNLLDEPNELLLLSLREPAHQVPARCLEQSLKTIAMMEHRRHRMLYSKGVVGLDQLCVGDADMHTSAQG